MFRVNTDGWNQFMPIPDVITKQQAVDKAREFYDKAVLNVYGMNELNQDIKIIPFGSKVQFSEYDRKTGKVIRIMKRLLNYNLMSAYTTVFFIY